VEPARPRWDRLRPKAAVQPSGFHTLVALRIEAAPALEKCFVAEIAYVGATPRKPTLSSAPAAIGLSCASPSESGDDPWLAKWAKAPRPAVLSGSRSNPELASARQIDGRRPSRHVACRPWQRPARGTKATTCARGPRFEATYRDRISVAEPYWRNR